MVVVAVGMLSQSLDLRVIVADQNPLIYGLILPLGLVIFFISGLAELSHRIVVLKLDMQSETKTEKVPTPQLLSVEIVLAL